MANGTKSAAPLAGQAALVTGGSSGIGAGVVEAFAAAGAAVAINYNSRSEEAEAAARRIEEAGGRAFAVGADVADEAEARELLANDPYTEHGIIAEASIHGWNVVFNRDAEH